MSVIPNFNKYSENWQRNNPANLKTNYNKVFDKYWDDQADSHNKYLDNIANSERRKSMFRGKGIGIIGGGLVGGLAGNLIGRNAFNKKNPKEKFISKYLYENPLATKEDAERLYDKFKRNTLIKSSLIGAGLGAGVGYIGGSSLTKYLFNNRLKKAKELGSRRVLNRRDEILKDFGQFRGEDGTIIINDSYNSDGQLNKNVSIEKLIKNRDLGNELLTESVGEGPGGIKVRSKFKMNTEPITRKWIEKEIVQEPILNEGETFEEGLKRLKEKFNNPNKHKNRNR